MFGKVAKLQRRKLLLTYLRYNKYSGSPSLVFLFTKKAQIEGDMGQPCVPGGGVDSDAGKEHCPHDLAKVAPGPRSATHFLDSLQ